MKNIQNLCFLLVFILATLVIGCQESAADKQSDTPPLHVEKQKTDTLIQPQPTTIKGELKSASSEKGPKILVTKEFHDFGDIGPGTHHTCEFTFKNIGTAMLKIDNVQSTCGCSVPQLKKNDYAPGEPGAVEVRFHAPTHKGETKKQLYIISNDPANPRAQIEVRAAIAVKVEVKPEEMSLMLNKPNAGLVPLTIKGLDNREFSITKVSSTNNAITCDFKPDQKAAEFVLHPVADPNQLARFLSGVIQIEVDHPQGGTLLVRYSTLPQYEVNRPRIILQNAKPGQKELKDVIITSHYGDTLKIASASSRLGYMKIVDQEIEEKALKLSIEISMPDRESANKRYFSDELTIKFENNQEVAIRVSGWFKN